MKLKILIIMLLMITIFAHNHFTCVFDHYNKDLTEISRQTPRDIPMLEPFHAGSNKDNKDSNQGRKLLTITRNPIRITIDSSNFTVITPGLNGASNTDLTRLAFLLRTMTIAVSFLTKRIKVYPMSSLTAPIQCFDHPTPNNDRSIGISGSDLHIYVLYTTDKN